MTQGISRQHAAMALWLLAAALGAIVMLSPAYVAVADGHYIPVGNDAFYHARRILGMIAEPSNLQQFDPLIHAPEGSMLAWPWGYDYAMSLLTRAGLALGLSSEPMAILDHIPVVALGIALVMVLLICRALELRTGAIALALLATALFPFNQALYSVGSIDHHFAEHIFVLGALGTGMAWLRAPESKARALAVGVALGVAPCIHNGLFVLQVPIVLTFAWAWVRRMELPRSTAFFAAALVGATIAVAVPSAPFRQGAFEFYTLSWFHVYVAACTALVCTLQSRLAYSLRRGALLAGLCVLLAAPAGGQVLIAHKFLGATVEGMGRIAEAQSPWTLALEGRLRELAQFYSYLIVLAPVTFGFSAYALWRERELYRVLFRITCCAGLLLLALQLRMHYFGSFALYLPLIVYADETFRGDVERERQAMGVCALVLLLCYVPGLQFTLLVRKVTGNDPYYALTYDIFPDFARQCARAPGIALASLDDGHYIRYHTNCAVIANNFLLTPQHERKVREVRALMEMSPRELQSAAPYVRYVYVRRMSLFRRRPEGGLQFMPGGDPSSPDPALVRELLERPPDNLPPGFRLLKELAFERPAHLPYARLFMIEPQIAGTAAAVGSTSRPLAITQEDNLGLAHGSRQKEHP